MALFPTFKILVYRTLQNAIQPPSAGKKLTSPHLGLSSAVPQVQLRPSVHKGGTKAKSLQKSWLHFQLWRAASLRTKQPRNCTQETHFYPDKDKERHPTNAMTVASVTCGTSPQHSGFGWAASRSAHFQEYPSCPPHCWSSQLTKHVALFLTGNYQIFFSQNHLISQQFFAMIALRVPVLIPNHGYKMKAQHAASKSLAPTFTCSWRVV